MNDIILTGPPRSGTTLACHLLNKLEDTVALHEPMNIKMFPDRKNGIVSVRSFYGKMRDSLMKDGTALSKVSDGKIPANPFGNSGNKIRASIVRKETVHFDKPLSTNFKLIIKQNGHFTFLLPELQDHFPVYIIIRNPVATLLSWNSINAPVAKGNLRILQNLDPELYHSLNNEPDLIKRMVILLDKMYQAYLLSTKAIIIRYEELVSSGGTILKKIVPVAEDLMETLKNKNSNPIYDQKLSDKIKSQLLDHNGSYSDFYSEDAIRNQ